MTDPVLLETLNSLPAQQRAEVEDFVEFLAAEIKAARALSAAATVLADYIELVAPTTVSDEKNQQRSF